MHRGKRIWPSPKCTPLSNLRDLSVDIDWAPELGCCHQVAITVRLGRNEQSGISSVHYLWSIFLSMYMLYSSARLFRRIWRIVEVKKWQIGLLCDGLVWFDAKEILSCSKNWYAHMTGQDDEITRFYHSFRFVCRLSTRQYCKDRRE